MLYVVMSWKKTWLNKQNQWVNYKMPWFYSNHCPWVKISGFFFFSSVTVGFIVTESFKSWVIISWNKRSNDLKQITNEQSDNYIVPTEGYKKNQIFIFHQLYWIRLCTFPWNCGMSMVSFRNASTVTHMHWCWHSSSQVHCNFSSNQGCLSLKREMEAAFEQFSNWQFLRHFW